ncbi:MAG: 3-isopropylmalate dehydratase large subunit [Desulfurella sp.]|jgi:3-isopropylmalate/(R)-2-methylmalate dehydratase large subunit|uniref:3-isopropylmalate dehydratase large subunit n=1 Tax=Desulfurella multipotens TaxID=79269 RepID=A0A1G6PXX8_9BACT|nr:MULTISPECIES: 3-isopropylmalate dehydratase large subunit [Desulfurella]PMP91375.1 MAG: 3-isopropylmalate dehydratase large subunit [Desulfurella sp.]SDC84821.1 3-isopropylmalate/(R)-2-methylmalate dehydratase large subunit [Desulfurella multipotens]
MEKMTISQKILAKHAKKDFVKPGEIILADVDLAFANDVTAPIVIKFVNDLGGVIANKDKIALIPDHFTPNKDINSANQCKIMRDFVKQNNIKHYWESGEVGIEHALLPEQGYIKPGMLIVGADSHTCTHGAFGAFATGMGSSDVGFAFATGKSWFRVPESIKFIINGKRNKWVGGKDFILKIIGTIGVDGALYKSMEFCGSAISELPMDDRMTMCNMAIEAGGKNGIIEADETTINYLKERNIADYEILKSDEDAQYVKIYEFDASNIEPQVAFPHLPENTKGISEIKEDIKIDQAFIGSCTNGRISDLRIAAEILKNNKVAKYVRLIIIPATVEIYKQAMKEGLFDIFLEAGAVISTPTCGPCLGGHMGILADSEVAVSTSNRNFVGRMGSPKSFVYLANPAVVAASAVAGKIINPVEVIK